MRASSAPALKFPKPIPRVLERKAEIRARTMAALKARTQVWVRAMGKCEKCGRRAERSVDSLRAGNVHHVVYRSRGGKDDPANLILTCRECHRDIHGRRTR